MPRNHDPKGHKGFTLAEMLMVMLITSIIVLGVNASFEQVHAIWSKAESPRPRHQVTRTLFEVLRNEFAGLYIPPPPDQGAAPAPFELFYEEQDRQTLTFYSLTPSWQTTPAASRPARITYTFTRDPDSAVGQLERREQLWAAQAPLSSETSQTVARGLLNCEFSVITPDSTSANDPGQKTFTAQDRPPKAITIRLIWPTDKPDRVASFDSYFCVPCQGAVPQDQ